MALVTPAKTGRESISCLQYYAVDRRTTWLELFFDLIFVVAIGKVTSLLAHVPHGYLTSEQLWKFPLVFIPLWWIWVSHTLYSNRFDTDSKPHRLATLLIMFLLVVLSVFLGLNFDVNYPGFIVCYCAIRFIISIMYIKSNKKHDGAGEFAAILGFGFLAGACISLSSFLFEPPYRYMMIYLGILFDMLFPMFIRNKLQAIPIHTEHLVERTGLLTIILLGESVISLAGGLSYIQWDRYNVMAAVTGFVMICSIWWIYFDSFYLLSENKKISTGHSLVYSHLFLLMGLAILANLIRHAILNDLSIHDFQLLTIIGMVSFFLGKQYEYFMVVPKGRRYIISNTMIVFVLTGLSLFLPRIEYILVGVAATMICYVLLNFRAMIIVLATTPTCTIQRQKNTK